MACDAQITRLRRAARGTGATTPAVRRAERRSLLRRWRCRLQRAAYYGRRCCGTDGWTTVLPRLLVNGVSGL